MPGGGGNLGTVGRTKTGHLHTRRFEKRQFHAPRAKDIVKNPFYAEISLHRTPAGTHIEVFDAEGGLVKRVEAPVRRGKTYRLDLSELPAGEYVIRRRKRTLFGFTRPASVRINKPTSPVIARGMVLTPQANIKTTSKGFLHRVFSLLGLGRSPIALVLSLLIGLGLVSIVKGAGVGVITKPSYTGSDFIGDSLKCCLVTTDTLIDIVGTSGNFSINDLNFSPTPTDGIDTVAYIYGTNDDGASILVKNPNYSPGVTCQFPDVAPTDEGGEHNIMIDMKIFLDNTEIDEYSGDFKYIIKRKEDVSDSVSQLILGGAGYFGHISNLSFTNPPRHGDSLIAIVEKTYSGQKWRDSLIVEMDTTEYWSAYVIPDITLNPEDSVISGIAEGNKGLKPLAYEISAHPNPFNSSVTITIDGSVGAIHELPLPVEIFDLNGRFIDIIPPAPLNKGGVERSETGGLYIWQPGESIGSGVYLVRATVGEATATKRIVFLK